jgi:hypothetical protein
MLFRVEFSHLDRSFAAKADQIKLIETAGGE